MMSAEWHALRLSSEGCLACEDLRRRKARIADDRRSARNLYGAAVMALDSAALQNLEEELKQTSAAHKLVCHAVNPHLANQHTRRTVSAWRRNGP